MPRATKPSTIGAERTSVREFSVPATTEVGPDEAIPDLLAANVAAHGDEVGYRVHRDGRWQDVTWKQFADQVAGVAKGLIAAGVEAAEGIALHGKAPYRGRGATLARWD